MNTCCGDFNTFIQYPLQTEILGVKTAVNHWTIGSGFVSEQQREIKQYILYLNILLYIYYIHIYLFDLI